MDNVDRCLLQIIQTDAQGRIIAQEKRLGPTTSKGLRKTAAKYFERTLGNQSVIFYAW